MKQRRTHKRSWGQDNRIRLSSNLFLFWRHQHSLWHSFHLLISSLTLFYLLWFFQQMLSSCCWTSSMKSSHAKWRIHFLINSFSNQQIISQDNRFISSHEVSFDVSFCSDSSAPDSLSLVRPSFLDIFSSRSPRRGTTISTRRHDVKRSLQRLEVIWGTSSFLRWVNLLWVGLSILFD